MYDGVDKKYNEWEICSSNYRIRLFKIFDTTLNQMSEYSEY